MAENDQMRAMLQENQTDFKDLLAQLDGLREELAQKTKLAKEMEKELEMRPSLREANSMRVEIKHLHNQLSQFNSEPKPDSPEPNRRSAVEPPVKALSDAKLILSEALQIFQIDSSDSVVILDALRKISKVLQAVPRMEGFITNISRTVNSDPTEALPLD